MRMKEKNVKENFKINIYFKVNMLISGLISLLSMERCVENLGQHTM